MSLFLLILLATLAPALSAPASAEILSSADITLASDFIGALVSRGGDKTPSPEPNMVCILGKCHGAITKCLMEQQCRNGMFCTAKCGFSNDACIFHCASDFEDPLYDAMIRCFFTENPCMKMPKGHTFSSYQMCRPLNVSKPLTTYRGAALTVAQTQTLMTRNGEAEGYWRVARGLSASYDCFDCQNVWFQTSKANASQLEYSAIYQVNKTDGSFKWNRASYNGDFDTFDREPGRVHFRAPDYAGLVHEEDWRVLAVDERVADKPQWLAMYYCGGAPGVMEAYEGSCVLTPTGLMPDDPTETKKIDAVYAAAGITLACVPNEREASCAEHPTPP